MTSTAASVCIPAWNASRFVERAVRSALGSRSVTEVVVVDDGSTDGTGAVVASIDDPRVRLERNPLRLGRAPNIQRAFDLATGTHVLLLPADDELEPGGVDLLAEALDGSPAAFSFGGVRIVDEGGAELGRHRPFSSGWSSPPVESVARLLPHDPVFTAGALIRRDVLHDVGGLRLDIAPSHRDWDLFLRLAATSGATYVDEVVVADRSHPANFTDQIRGTDFTTHCELLVLDAFGRWAGEHAPACLGALDEGRRAWSRSKLGEVILARAGLRGTDPAASFGMATAGNPSFRREPRWWLAGCLLLAPRAVSTAARPLLRRFDPARSRP